jgi:hypothetical protein
MNTWASAEMLKSKIKDLRRRKSMATILNNLAERPGLSFSAAAGSAKRQAAHRLFSDEAVTISDLLSGHYQQSRARIEEECRGGLVLIVQDTTEFSFTKLKATTGLGYINDTLARGLFGHSALCLTPQGLPLGVAHLEIWARDEADYGKGKDRRKLDIQQKESYRWIHTLQIVEEQLPAGQHALFVQDREADIFAFLQAPKRSTTFLLVRANQPRRVEILSDGAQADPIKGLLFDAACAAPVVGRMQVSIPRAKGRSEQTVELIIQTVRVRILPPKGRKGVSDQPIVAWVVRASELHPPTGVEAIEWVLVSTLPILDGLSACQLVGYYSKRWTIERLHFAIKTGGCNAEQLRMDDAATLSLALALYYVTAWRLLYVTYLARVQPEAPADWIISTTEKEVLEAIGKKPITTTSSAVLAIAKLGGYEPYKNGPPPGIKVLWIGLRRLEDMQTGWLLAKQNLTLHAPLRYET